MSLWAIERFFKERKIGWFIFAIAYTLFSNFYFSYYEAIVIGFYFIYRFAIPHEKDIVNRWQKLYILVCATLLSVLVSIYGLYTGISSFLDNDRAQNPNFKITFSQIYLKPIIIFLLMVFTLQFLLLLSLHYFVLNYINTIIINCSQLQLGFYLSVPFLNGLTVHLMVFITPKTLGLLFSIINKCINCIVHTTFK